MDSQALLFIFKLQLYIGLITSQEIKVWACEQLLEGNSNDFILDLCFLKDEMEIRDYIDLSYNTHGHVDEEGIALWILKRYFEEKFPREQDNNLDEHIKYLQFIANYLWSTNKWNLWGYIAAYKDQIDWAREGYLTITVEEAYREFYTFLKVNMQDCFV